MRCFRKVKYRAVLLFPLMALSIITITLYSFLRLNFLSIIYLVAASLLVCSALFITWVDFKYKDK